MRTNLNDPSWDTLRAVVHVASAPVRLLGKKSFSVSVENHTDRPLRFLGPGLPQRRAGTLGEEDPDIAREDEDENGDVSHASGAAAGAAVPMEGGSNGAEQLQPRQASAKKKKGRLRGRAWGRRGRQRAGDGDGGGEEGGGGGDSATTTKPPRGFKGEWQLRRDVAPGARETAAFGGRSWSNAGLFRLEGAGDLVCFAAASRMTKGEGAHAAWTADLAGAWRAMPVTGESRVWQTAASERGDYEVSVRFKNELPFLYWTFVVSARTGADTAGSGADGVGGDVPAAATLAATSATSPVACGGGEDAASSTCGDGGGNRVDVGTDAAGAAAEKP